MTLTDSSRKISRFGARYVLEARLRNMFKFIWVIAAISFLNPLLYLISFGVGIGSLITSNMGENGIDGVSYLTFVAPALLASAAIQGAMDEAIFPTINGFKWSKIFYGMNATPQTGSTIASGVFLTVLVRTTISVLAYSFVLYLFGAMDSPHAYLAVPIAILSGASFGAVMMAFASRVTNEDLFFTIVGRFLFGPMFLFSGTFYPLASLPIGLQFIGWISPLWHATELGRYATYGHSISPTMVMTHLLVILIMLVLGLLSAFKQFSKRLTK